MYKFRLPISIFVVLTVTVIAIYSVGMTHTSNTTTIHPIYAANFADDSILIGASHNVFVGKVSAQVGNQDLAGTPATQFSVEVLKNIKGELNGIITVEQQGGEKDGTMYVFEDSLPMLQPGTTYLFATRYNAKEGWHTLNSHPNASKLLSSDDNKTEADLQSIANQDEKVRAFEATYPEEKLLDADLAHNNTRNAFKSLDTKSKAAAQSRADEAKASLAAKAQ